MTVELEEFAPNRWRVVKKEIPPKRAALSFPTVISDEMDAVEQVDGRWYTSKSEFRKVGRSLGLVEVGNEKCKPKARGSITPENKRRRREVFNRAIEHYKQGRRAIA